MSSPLPSPTGAASVIALSDVAMMVPEEVAARASSANADSARVPICAAPCATAAYVPASAVNAANSGDAPQPDIPTTPVARHTHVARAGGRLVTAALLGSASSPALPPTVRRVTLCHDPLAAPVPASASPAAAFSTLWQTATSLSTASSATFFPPDTAIGEHSAATPAHAAGHLSCGSVNAHSSDAKGSRTGGNEGCGREGEGKSTNVAEEPVGGGSVEATRSPSETGRAGQRGGRGRDEGEGKGKNSPRESSATLVYLQFIPPPPPSQGS